MSDLNLDKAFSPIIGLVPTVENPEDPESVLAALFGPGMILSSPKQITALLHDCGHEILPRHIVHGRGDVIEHIARRIYLESIDLLGWPNGCPTWNELPEKRREEYCTIAYGVIRAFRELVSKNNV